MTSALPEQPLWARFSADPRRYPSFRASDADRDVATEVVNAAFADGRLDVIEHSERLQSLLQAKTLGEIVPQLADIVLADPKLSIRSPAFASGAIRSWLALAVLLNVIWVASWLFSGIAPYYYWPIWPMIGTGAPMLIAYVIGTLGGSGGGDAPRDGRREIDGR